MRPKDIDAIAYRVAVILTHKLKDELASRELPEMVGVSEAAKILNISASRLRHIKDKFPHVKSEGKQGRILFIRSALLENY